MYKDYLDAIRRHYERLKLVNGLPLRLLNPSPGKIRDECVTVFKSRPRKADERILKTFFEVSGELDLRAIRKFGLDKFKPLANFLNEGTDSPAHKNIELLGWLLDFPKRPYNDRIDYSVDDEPLSGIELEGGGEKYIGGFGDEPTGKPVDEGEMPSGVSSTVLRDSNLKSRHERIWRLLAIIAILLGVGATVYFSSNRKSPFGNAGSIMCMVWVDDHYERISCDSSVNLGLVVALDENRLNNLRRIKRPDTITEEQIGKLWYKKRSKDSLDYYTAGGMDPSNPNRDLDRLTRYIFDKYLRKANR